MQTIKMTSKRQATFPAELCQQMGIHPGDELVLEHRLINGEMCWILYPHERKLSWLGALRKYAKNKPHAMEDIRRSIANARKK